jgi:lipoprotein-releasing system ATP-binding protein
VAMPLLIAGVAKSDALKQASELLEQVGMGQRLKHRPAQLSGGERQRVAIARALVMSPACVLMDEPTGNLDPGASEQVLGLIDSLKQETTASFIVVTHDAAIAARMDAIYDLGAAGLLLREGSVAS